MSTNGQYEEFLRSVQPVTIALNSCTAKIDRASVWALYEKATGPVDRGFINVLEAHYRLGDVSGDAFDVIATLAFSDKSEKGANAPLSIRCEVAAHFHQSAQMTTEHAKRFADSEVRLIVWPYFREIVSNMTARMGIPPIFLPFTFRRFDPYATASRKPGTKARTKQTRTRPRAKPKTERGRMTS